MDRRRAVAHLDGFSSSEGEGVGGIVWAGLVAAESLKDFDLLTLERLHEVADVMLLRTESIGPGLSFSHEHIIKSLVRRLRILDPLVANLAFLSIRHREVLGQAVGLLATLLIGVILGESAMGVGLKEALGQ